MPPSLILPSPRLAICASLCIALPLAFWECAVSTTTTTATTTTRVMLTTGAPFDGGDAATATATATAYQSLDDLGFEVPRTIIAVPTRRDESSQPQKRPLSSTKASSTSSLSKRTANAALFNSSLTSRTNDRQKAFELAVKRALARRRSQSTPLVANLKSLFPNFTPKNATPPAEASERRLINLIRIPKAGSSALSATARALVGCGPDGYACCDPVASNLHVTPACPLVDSSCPAVRGCTGHNPDYTFTTTTTGKHNEHEHDDYEPTITSLRHPASRALSAFFYARPHRPPGGCKTWQCFDQDFVQHPRWRNPVTKMLSGYFPYRNLDRITDNNEMPISVHAAKRRLCNMVWFGISEMDIASSLLLYEVYPFSQLLPNPVAFGLPANHVESQQQQPPKHMMMRKKSSNPKRTNTNEEYLEFKNGIYQEMNGTALVEQYHADDMEVYRFGVELFCERVRDSGLINDVVAVVEATGLLWHHFQACATAAATKEGYLSLKEQPKLCDALEAESFS